MNVVLLDIEFNDFPMFPLADCFEDSSQFTFDLLCPEDFAAILRRPDEVVFEVVEAMG